VAQAWDAEVLALSSAREVARKARNWKEADQLRDQLLEHGVVVEDGPSGQKLKRR
jgi:cysteinyl-tRNA synthetase